MTIAIITHADCLAHDTGPEHPEDSRRLTAILEELQQCPFADQLQFLEAPLAREETILLAHDIAYVRSLTRMDMEEPIHLDEDTIMSPGSIMAAFRAVGAVCLATDKVMAGEFQHGFCAIRPPGHHATPNKAMGFCLFNNIAIGALYAQQHYGLERIAIVDFDVHHGNGTQAIIEQHPDIFYLSTHQSPLWPGTGRTMKSGQTNILNIPLPPGTEGAYYQSIWQEIVLPAVDNFQPDLLYVSAGFDAHAEDPLAEFVLVEEDYYWLGSQLRLLAERHTGGKIISALEGGYTHYRLAKSVVAYLSAFL